MYVQFVSEDVLTFRILVPASCFRTTPYRIYFRKNDFILCPSIFIKNMVWQQLRYEQLTMACTIQE